METQPNTGVKGASSHSSGGVFRGGVTPGLCRRKRGKGAAEVLGHIYICSCSLAPPSSCFFIRPGFQAKVRQTGRRTWCNVPKRRDDGFEKSMKLVGDSFSFFFFLYKTRNLNQVCNANSTVWYMTELTSLNNNHLTVTKAQLGAIFQSNQFCFFFFFSCAIPHAIILLSYRLCATIQLCNYPDTPWHANYCQSSPYSGVLNTIYSVVNVQNETYIFTYFNTYAAAMYRWFNAHSTSLFSYIFLLYCSFSFLYPL